MIEDREGDEVLMGAMISSYEGALLTSLYDMR
jgi:hypothetical protein